MSQRGKFRTIIFENQDSDPNTSYNVYLTNVFNFGYCRLRKNPDLTLQPFLKDENGETEENCLVNKNKASHVFTSSGQRVRICCKVNGVETTILKRVFKKDTKIIISKSKIITSQDKSTDDSTHQVSKIVTSQDKSSKSSTSVEYLCKFKDVNDEEYIEALMKWGRFKGGKYKSLVFENQDSDPNTSYNVYLTNVFNFGYCRLRKNPDLTLQPFLKDENGETEENCLVNKNKASHVFTSSGQRVRICCKVNGVETTILKRVFKKDTKIIISKSKIITSQDKSTDDSTHQVSKIVKSSKSSTSAVKYFCKFEQVNDEEYIEAVKNRGKFHAVKFENNSRTNYYVSFHGSLMRRTGQIFCVKPGESYLKVFAESIKFQIRQNKSVIKKKKTKKESFTITVEGDGNVIEKELSEEEDNLRKGLQEKISFYKKFTADVDRNLYTILGLKEKPENITPKDIEEGYQAKKEKNNSKYSKEEIENAYRVLSNAETRRQYDEFYDFIKEEKNFEKCSKFFSKIAWGLRGKLSPFSSEKTKEEKKDAWKRVGCLTVCLIIAFSPFFGPMIIPGLAGLTVYAKMTILFGIGYGTFAGFSKVFDDGEFSFKAFLASTIGHAIIGAGVGALFAWMLSVIPAVIPTKVWLQHGVIGAATNCAGSILSSLLIGIIEKYVEKKDITWKDIALNVVLTGLLAIPAGFLTGLIFFLITKWAVSNPTDEIIEQGVQVKTKQLLWRRFLALLFRGIVHFKVNVLNQSSFTSIREYCYHGADEVEYANNFRDALIANAPGAFTEIGGELVAVTHNTVRNNYDPPEFEIRNQPTQNAKYFVNIED